MSDMDPRFTRLNVRIEWRQVVEPSLKDVVAEWTQLQSRIFNLVPLVMNFAKEAVRFICRLSLDVVEFKLRCQEEKKQ